MRTGRPKGEITKEERVQRFWAKVDKTGECWLWTGALSGGYGRLYVGDERWSAAHRFAYEQLIGPIPDGLQLDHRTTCPKNCVNPDHLRPVTNKQNAENRVGAQGNSQSGVRGVSPFQGRWKATVRHEGRTIIVGMFDTVDEASEAVRLKRIELFTHNDLDREEA